MSTLTWRRDPECSIGYGVLRTDRVKWDEKGKPLDLEIGLPMYERLFWSCRNHDIKVVYPNLSRPRLDGSNLSRPSVPWTLRCKGEG